MVNNRSNLNVKYIVGTTKNCKALEQLLDLTM